MCDADIGRFASQVTSPPRFAYPAKPSTGYPLTINQVRGWLVLYSPQPPTVNEENLLHRARFRARCQWLKGCQGRTIITIHREVRNQINTSRISRVPNPSSTCCLHLVLASPAELSLQRVIFNVRTFFGLLPSPASVCLVLSVHLLPSSNPRSEFKIHSFALRPSYPWCTILVQG